MLPDLITEGVLLHVGRYNSQRVERPSGNTIEDVNNPYLELKFPDFPRAMFKTLLSLYFMEHEERYINTCKIQLHSYTKLQLSRL